MKPSSWHSFNEFFLLLTKENICLLTTTITNLSFEVDSKSILFLSCLPRKKTNFRQNPRISNDIVGKESISLALEERQRQRRSKELWQKNFHSSTSSKSPYPHLPYSSPSWEESLHIFHLPIIQLSREAKISIPPFIWMIP